MCTNTRASAFYIPTTLYTTFTTTYILVVVVLLLLLPHINDYYNFSIVFFDDIFSASESFLAISNC